jgi:hypothetical protein
MRARRVSYRDGLSEIVLGIICLQQLCGDLIIRSGSLPGSVVYFVLLVAFAIYARRIMDAVRARITYLRTGYARTFTRKGWTLIGMVLALLGTYALITVLHARRAGSPDAAGWVQGFPALAGLGLGAIEIYVGMRYGARRAFLVGIFSMVLGVVVSIEYSWILALTILLVGFGCANLCSGIFALLRYLRSPIPSAALNT